MNKNLFDIKYAKKYTKGYDLKVDLKKNFKGVSLFAKKFIKKGSVVAYYKFRAYNEKRYISHKDGMYSMAIYNKDGSANEYLIGDIYDGSLDKPKYNIPYWAYFSNEPSGNQSENVYLDHNNKYNFKKRNYIKEGDTLVYRLIALKDIKRGEEICWCYGPYYTRDYDSNCN